MKSLWLVLIVLAGTPPMVTHAQDTRLARRLPGAVQDPVARMLDSATAEGLPTEPLVDRALEGAAKGASGNLIVSAVRRLWMELRISREAFGPTASLGELGAGASAVRAGATLENLVQLRTQRSEQSLTVAAAVLADLVAVGVPADTAIAAVLALAPLAADEDYMAFRRNVESDIALGASPSTALGVRLAVTAESLDAASAAAGTRTGSGRRKP